MKASDYIIETLYEHNITKIFGFIGGAIAHITNSLHKNKKVELVNTIHEQGAGFAAEGYARSLGKIGVATATSGPGATNLITAIGSCYFDSVPTLFITGQVNTYEYKYNSKVRQRGFQETDIVSIIKPITKYAVLVDDARNLRYELEKSLYLAQHGRKGPVLIDIPMNIQRADINHADARSFFDSDEYIFLRDSVLPIQNDHINKFVDLLSKSSRPVFLIGGGVRCANAAELVRDFITKNEIPMVHSLMGHDVISSNYKYNLGLIGAYGNRYGNLALANSDLIVAIGSRLDTRQTGTNLNTFAREANIIHIDIDSSEFSDELRTTLKINTDIKSFIEQILPHSLKFNTDTWKINLLHLKEKYPSTQDYRKNIKVPNIIVTSISKHARPTDLISIDVGQHQMWVAQSFKNQNEQRLFFSGGMGSMGFALPAAIGSTIGTKRRTIVIIGDGGFQMNIQELEILKRRRLPIKIIVLNNYSLGMVRQFQELYFDKNYPSTVEDYSVPDFTKIAKAYGIDAKPINYKDDFNLAIKEALENDEPYLLDIQIDYKYTEVEPKLVVGKPIEDMSPYLDRADFRSNMIIKPLDEK